MNIEKIFENLPQIEGSEKQIAWAKDIRNTFIESVKYCFNKIENSKKEKIVVFYVSNFMDFMDAVYVYKYFGIDENVNEELTDFPKRSEDKEIAKDFLYKLSEIVLSEKKSSTWIDCRKKIETLHFREIKMPEIYKKAEEEREQRRKELEAKEKAQG